MLRYTENQFYGVHTDYIDFQLDRPSGVRVLTLYIYLNDVEEGGGTNFPKADQNDPNFTVQPKRGVRYFTGTVKGICASRTTGLTLAFVFFSTARRTMAFSSVGLSQQEGPSN